MILTYKDSYNLQIQAKIFENKYQDRHSPRHMLRYNSMHWLFDYQDVIRHVLGYKLMSKKPAKTSFTWKGYVNAYIPESMTEQVGAFLKDDKKVFFQFNDMIVRGYSFKIYFDEKSESFKCTITCNAQDSGNYGYALSAYAETWYDALGVSIFKHVVILEANWQEQAESTKRSFG